MIAGALVSAAASAYAASLRRPGAVVVVPEGSLAMSGGYRCSYCRRTYSRAALPETCKGCGASEFSPAGGFSR